MRGYDRTEWSCLAIICAAIVASAWMGRPWDIAIMMGVCIPTSAYLARHMFRRAG
jgi:hypothetical protein